MRYEDRWLYHQTTFSSAVFFKLSTFSNKVANEIGEIGEWIIHHALLEGSEPKNNLPDETRAIYDGAIPLITLGGFEGISITSGLSQVEDDLLSIELSMKFLARRVEEI